MIYAAEEAREIRRIIEERMAMPLPEERRFAFAEAVEDCGAGTSEESSLGGDGRVQEG